MRAPRTWIIALFLTVGAVLGVWYYDDASVRVRHLANGDGHKSVEEAPVVTLPVTARSDQFKSTPSTNEIPPNLATHEPAETAAASAGSAATPTISQSANRAGQRYSWADGIDPKGIPFPVSESVKRMCKRYERGGKASCDEHYEVLSQLEKESRDTRWAHAMEDLIASRVAAQPGFFIRSLDCRTSVCAVEIEGIGVVFRNSGNEFSGKLSEVDRIIGYERNESKELVKVTSITFRRVAGAD